MTPDEIMESCRDEAKSLLKRSEMVDRHQLTGFLVSAAIFELAAAVWGLQRAIKDQGAGD